MKSKVILSVIVFLILGSQINLGQVKVKVPKSPEFDFEYHEFFKMSEEDEKKLLKNIDEELRKELEVIKKANEHKYFDFLRESQFKHMKLPFLVKREKISYERDQKIFEAEVKAEALASKYKMADRANKEKIKRDLKKELSVLFEKKEERRKEEVAELENELKELKKSLEVRQKNKNQIIERRLQELLEEDEYLEWD